MTEINLDFIGKQLTGMQNEMRAMRLELRRLTETQAMTARAITDQRDSLELMIRTEIGGLFANLERRLEQRIDEAMRKANAPTVKADG